MDLFIKTLFMVLTCTVSSNLNVNLEYSYAKSRNPCDDQRTAKILENRLRDAFGKLPCLKKKTCKIRLNGPCMNTDIDLSITIQRTDSASTDFDVDYEGLTLERILSPILEPYLVKENPCGPDRVFWEGRCRKCSPGTYMIDGMCLDCPVGFYTTAVGAKKCSQCSSHKTTSEPGATDSSYCQHSCRLDELISADHHLQNSYEVVVDGSNLTVECSGNWAFDLLGTKKLSVKCVHPIPSCSVRYCPQSCDGGFTCDSCQCVNTTSTARCDGVQHCSDGSDEMGCPVEVEFPSSLQFTRQAQNSISVPKTWDQMSNMAVCLWARLKLDSSYSSLVSFEQKETHSFWLKITKDSMFVQVNKMIYREVPLPYSVDRQWFSVCANVNHRTLELYLNGEPLLNGADKDIFAVQGQEISGDVVIGGVTHSSHPPYMLDGLLKDLYVWNKPLSLYQVTEFHSKCLVPQALNIILDWGTVKNHSDPNLFLEQSYSKDCSAPKCEGLCPPNMWQCGSCDCIPLGKRCDRMQGHCLDGSDEIGCPLLDGQMSLIEEILTMTEAEESCLAKGGSLALLSTDYIMDYATKILMYYDYDKAWSINSNTGEAGLFTKLGKWINSPSSDIGHAALCQRSRTSIYRYIDHPRSYEESIAECEMMSGQLATISTIPQLELLEKVITSHQFKRTPVWVGGGMRDGYVAWNNGDLFTDLRQGPKYKSGDKLSIDTQGNWELRNGTSQRPFVCMVETIYNHTTSLVFNASENSVVKITDPIPGIAVIETTVCVSFKSASTKGTIISYATSRNDNELLVLVTSEALLIMIHNVPFFVNTDLADGLWHSLCFAYSAEEHKLRIFIDEEDWSIERAMDSATAGSGRYGIMILGAEQDFREKTTVRELDEYQYFEGDIVNFNIWKDILSEPELKYLSSTLHLCKTTLARDDRISLRWGDVLNFGTQLVRVGSMGDNEMCRSLGMNERFMLQVDGKPLVADDGIFKLCENTECKGVYLRLKTVEDSANVVAGSHVMIVLGNDKGSVVQCDETRCSLADYTGDESRFILLSQDKRPGETLEPKDTLYFNNVNGKTLRCDEHGCFLEDASAGITMFSHIIEKIGWSKWRVQGDCTGDCGNSQMPMVRTCFPVDLPDDLQGIYCPGDNETRAKCQLDSCTKTGKCNAGEIKDNFRGVIQWEKIEYQDYSADILCPAGNYHYREDPLIINVMCTSEGFDRDEMNKNVKSCAFISESAQLLHGLVEGAVTAGNVLHITTEMKNIMENADDLTVMHLEMLANLTERALETGNITMSVQDNIISTVDAVCNKIDVPQLWKAEMEDRIVRSLLEMIDRSADMVDLGALPGSAIIRESIALFVDKIDLRESIQVSITIADVTNMFTTELEIKSLKKAKLKGLSGIGIFLPTTIRQVADKHIDRVWFSVFKSDKLFISNETSEPGMVLPCNTSCQVASTIVGIGIGKNYGNIKNLKDDVIIQFTPPEGQVFNPTASCVYWNVTTSWWSNKGVKTEVDYKNNKIICKANHLTNFAVLMNVGNITMSGIHLDALQTITLVGGSVSIVCLFLTILGLAKFKSLRKTPSNKIHISLSFSLMMGLICLLIGLDRTESYAVCTMFAIMIHFFYLSALCWMMVEGVNLYIAFVKVFTGGQTHFYKKCAAFAFGFPAAVVLSTSVVNFTSSYPVYADGNMCWLSYIPSLITFVGPVLIMLLANLIIFAFVIKQIFWRKQASSRNKMDHFQQLRAVLCLMALMGLGWIVGAFTVSGPSGLVFQYIFTLTNISQGILIFYFHCASKPDVRNAWINSFSTSSSWSGKNANSQMMQSKVHTTPAIKKEEISEPKVPDDGVYNPFCNIMGINVPLKRRVSVDTIDSGYAYSPFTQLEYEERFTVDLKRKGSASGSSIYDSKDTKENGIMPATTKITSRSRRNSPRSPGSSDIALREANENDCPLFPPPFTPPPPPSSTDIDSKISFDMTSDPPTPPPLMTFSESEQDSPCEEHQVNDPLENDHDVPLNDNGVNLKVDSSDMMIQECVRPDKDSLELDDGKLKDILTRETNGAMGTETQQDL